MQYWALWLQNASNCRKYDVVSIFRGWTKFAVKGNRIWIPAFILDMGPNISKLLEPLFSFKYNRSRVQRFSKDFLCLRQAFSISIKLWYLCLYYISVGQGGIIIWHFFDPGPCKIKASNIIQLSFKSYEGQLYYVTCLYLKL